MKYSVEQWIEAIRPRVEKEFGALPNYAVEKTDSQEAGKAPWCIDYQKSRPVFLYAPGNIARCQRKADGYLIYALIHDVVHFYQMEPLCEIRENDDADYERFQQWIEGAAELGALKICNEILTNQEKVQKLAAMFYDEQNLPVDLAGWMARHLMSQLTLLTGLKLIPARELEALALPFTLHASLMGYVRLCSILSLHMSSLREYFDYARGLARCARIVSSGKISLNALLRTPLKKRELRELAGI